MFLNVRDLSDLQSTPPADAFAGVKSPSGAPLGTDSDEAGPADDFDSALALASAAEQSFVHQALLDATREAIWMIDLQGNLLIENEAAKRLNGELFGITPDTPFKSRADIVRAQLVDGDSYTESMDDFPDPSAEQVQEWKHSRSGRIFSRYSGPVRNQSGSCIGRAFVTREVTKERESERLKDEFIALVSHELRTPLTSIIGYVDLLRDEETGPINEMQDGFIKTIERNTFRLQRIVGDLLFAALDDANRIVFEQGRCPIADVARQCVEGAEPAAYSRDINLSIVVDSEPVVLGDRERLSQVIDNLISNALKFTPPAGSVNVRVTTEGAQCVVSVSDSGMGMSKEEQIRLFQRFYRTERATEQAIQGTGLGLAICKTIVDKHGGEIGVDSTVNEGSTFYVKLPLQQED